MRCGNERLGYRAVSDVLDRAATDLRDLAGMKTCSKCQEELDESSFYKHSGHKDGLHSWCGDCLTEARRKRRLAERKAGGMPVKPMSVAIKDGLRQKMIVQYGIDLVEVLDTLE
jgi:hypothetical protein